jgi:hypothetical protein
LTIFMVIRSCKLQLLKLELFSALGPWLKASEPAAELAVQGQHALSHGRKVVV